MRRPVARRLPRPLATALVLALPIALGAQGPGDRRVVTVIQMNDIYRIDGVKDGTSGGPGRVVTVIEQARRETSGPVLALLAGDFIAPSLESRVFDGRPMVDALNAVAARAPLLVTAGNHEFDERTGATFARAVGASRFGWVLSNARVQTGDTIADRRLSRDTIVVAGGVRIGVFALTLIESPRAWVSVDTAHARIAEDAITRLEHRGADVIVGLTHLAMSDDEIVSRLRRRHPSFVWIAGGHEHYLQERPLTDSTALITKGDANARRIWRVTLSVERGGASGRRAREAGGASARAERVVSARTERVVMDEHIAVDSAYAASVITRYRDALRATMPYFDARIGTANVPLDATERTVRAGESGWGDVLTDIMRGAFPDVGADVAVLNGGSIRIDDEIAGPIRWEHLARTFGFPNRIGLVWLRGRDLRLAVLEQGVSADRPEGRFLQVSGLRFAYDPRRPAGERVTSVEIRRGERYEPLDESRTYVVAVPEYLYYGGDGFHFKDRAIQTIPPGPELKLMAFDAIAAAYARGEGVGGELEGRIRVVR